MNQNGKEKMRLEEYLNALKNCPDKKLQTELRIYDNYPIFMKGDFQTIVKDLQELENYKFGAIYNPGKTPWVKIKECDAEKYYNLVAVFDYIPGSLRLQVLNWIGGVEFTEIKEDIQKQKRDYNITIMIHLGLTDKKLPADMHIHRAMADIVEDVGKYILENRIPACLPGSGPDRLDDFSRIVYHASD